MLTVRLRVLSFMGRGNMVFPRLHFLFMHLLYVDESGHSQDATQRFFVMVGVSLFERQTYWISNELDKIAARFNPAEPHLIELHGSPMKQGKGQFEKSDSILYKIIESRFDQESGIVHGLHVKQVI
jgi:hypothetical protein